MTRRRLLRRFSPALAALTLAAAGCGEEDPRLLTEGRSEALLDLLDDAEKQFEDGECEELAATLEDFAQQVNEVQSEVDENVRTALRDESQELVNLQDECEPPEEPVVTETVPPPTTIETLPPPTTETAPPTTETTEEETVEEEPPEDQAQGNGPDGEGPPGQQPPEAESGGSSGSSGRGGEGEE